MKDQLDGLNRHAKTVATAAIPAPPIAGLQPYTGPWDRPQLVHLLKRTMFGARLGDINYFATKTMNEVVDELLQPTAAPVLPPLNNYSIDGYLDATGVAPWQTWVNASPLLYNQELNQKRIASLQAWWMGQLLHSQRSIHEKLTLFWHNHFAVNMNKDASIRAQLWYGHYLSLRNNALGNFTQLVKAVTLDPAMLFFLNGNTNKKTAPNENYGRELQELYTIGKGAGSAYTEDDVRAATRVLTGHTVRTDNYTYFFDAGEHDSDNKIFSAFYSNHIVTGKTGTPGATELDDMLAAIFATEEAARFICRKLYRFFIYYAIDEAIETNIIIPLADIFRNNNYNIQPVLSALFKSEHFYDLTYSSACVIKSPIDLVIGLLREFEVSLPASDNAAGQYDVWALLLSICSRQQQQIGAIPEVAGWYAYYLEPSFHETWINAVTYTERTIFTDNMILQGITQNTATIIIDPIAFASALPNPGDPNALIDDSLSILFRYPLSDATKAFIKESILLSGQTTDYYWTNAWDAYTSNPNDAMAKSLVQTRLQAFYKYLMNLPEYHLS